MNIQTTNKSLNKIIDELIILFRKRIQFIKSQRKNQGIPRKF